MASSPSNFHPPLPYGSFVALPDTFDPPNGSLDDEQIYRFWKVEDFFAGFENVVPSSSSDLGPIIFDGLTSARSSTATNGGGIKDVKVCEQDALTLLVTLDDESVLLIEAIRFDTLRIRWGPRKRDFRQYSQKLSRSIVMNTLSELRAELQKEEGYTLSAVPNDLRGANDGQGTRFEWSVQRSGVEHMKVIVHLDVFSIEIWRTVEQVVEPNRRKAGITPKTQWSLVWSTTVGNAKGQLPLLSRQDAEGNFATCLSFVKRGKLIGFGEQGGRSLLKDRQMLNIYNYDNLAYSSVYGQQALNPAEPLYHSDPFGVELNGVPGFKSAVGVFADDYSQVFFDLGARDPSAVRIGSRFADIEVHITCANDLQEVCQAHSSCVGRAKLFPRWVLGFHQGCYGYDTRDKVLQCADAYRRYNIPLDGIHIDVDLQKKYRTFTMDQEGEGAKFPDAKGMFGQLAKLGVKASTNITPVISSQDDQGKFYWDPSSAARSSYKTLDSGLKADVFVKDLRWNQRSNPPVYTYWEGGYQNTFTHAGNVENLNSPTGQAPEYRGGVSYGEGLTTYGIYPDLGRKEVRTWWGEQYQDLFEAGLSMVWQDMTTPCIMKEQGDMKTFPFRLLLSDDSESSREKRGVLTPALKINNLFSYNLHKATFHGVRQLAARKGLRNFIIGRGSFTGQHRFAGLWTGDNTSSFDFLRIYIQQVLSLGIGGTIIAGADVGGFEAYPFNSQWCDPTLLVRWVVANTLLPWFRIHYNGKPGHKLFQEPFAYAENAWRVPEQTALYVAVLPICQYYITLRYTMMQLLYDLMFDSLFHGKPLARSMFATDPWDLSLLDDNQHAPFLARQYVVGNDIIVAPIVHDENERRGDQNTQQRQVYLPSGSSFYSFNLHLGQQQTANGTSLQPSWQRLAAKQVGGEPFEYVSSIDRFAEGDQGHLPYLLPMYVRQGGIVPTRDIEMFVGEKKRNPIVIHFYPPAVDTEPASYNMYLDDGVSSASAPADMPQFKFDRQSGAQSDYRHVRLTQSTRQADSTTTRSITVDLLHKQFDIARTKDQIGDVLSLQIWYDVDETERARSAKVLVKRDNADDAVQSRYDDSLNAAIVTIPVDDVGTRIVTLSY